MRSQAVRAEAQRLVDLGYPKAEVARRLGVARTTVTEWFSPEARARRLALKAERKKPVMVPVDALAEAVLRCERLGTLRTEICERIDWSNAETSKLARCLGLMPKQNGTTATTIEEPLALSILRAIHLDPVDVGI